MGYSTFNYTANNYVEFVCDTENDISNLPEDCSPGSIAFVIEGAKVYMFNNSKEWVSLL